MSIIPSVESKFKEIIYKNPPLGKDDEYRLAMLWRNEHDSSAAEALVLSVSRLVYYVAGEYVKYGFPKADLIQEGVVGSMMAVKKFDPTKGHRLSTYASWWIRAYIQDYIMKMWRIVRPSLSKKSREIFIGLSKSREAIAILESDSDAIELSAKKYGLSVSDYKAKASCFIDEDVSLSDCPEISSEESTEDTVSKSEFGLRIKDEISSSMGLLTPREHSVIEMRYLSGDKETLSSIASDLDISINRVSQLEKSALNKLRKSMLSNKVLAIE